jgi:hypothetical protein
MMGNITSTLSWTRLQKYSLFQKYKALSATFQLVRIVPKQMLSEIPENEDLQQILQVD